MKTIHYRHKTLRWWSRTAALPRCHTKLLNKKHCAYWKENTNNTSMDVNRHKPGVCSVSQTCLTCETNSRVKGAGATRVTCASSLTLDKVDIKSLDRRITKAWWRRNRPVSRRRHGCLPNLLVWKNTSFQRMLFTGKVSLAARHSILAKSCWTYISWIRCYLFLHLLHLKAKCYFSDESLWVPHLSHPNRNDATACGEEMTSALTDIHRFSHIPGFLRACPITQDSRHLIRLAGECRLTSKNFWMT